MDKDRKAQLIPSVLADNYYYDQETFKESADIKNIPRNDLILYHSFGFQSHKRSNIHFIEDHIVLSSVGNALIFINLKTNEHEYLQGVRNGSISAIAIHPSKNYFAVAEAHKSGPNIYVFEYPSQNLYRVLRGGADKSYADIDFNKTGDKILSVAGDPDYMLTIWNWKSEAILLRSKAFSQDVYKCSFSPEDNGILFTSGMGHIKFWKMSSTFTGLKLQGQIGKFGASELTDIVSYVQLHYGKVLSTTETGNLLLWDGGMIKCEISNRGRRPCHAGRIECIIMTEAEIVTAGDDGYLRVWDLEAIDNADAGTQSGSEAAAGQPVQSSVNQPRIFELEPIEEILVAKDVKIRAAVRFPGSPQHYLVQDQQGNLLKLDTNKRYIDRLFAFHSGPIAGLGTSPTSHKMVTLGSDGSLRFYDYRTRSPLNKVVFAQPGSVLCYLPTCLDPAGKALAAGFRDGVLRIVSDDSNGVNLQYVFKPHTSAITHICISDDGSLLITGSEDKTIFLFKLEPINREKMQRNVAFSRESYSVKPIGFVSLDDSVSFISLSLEDNLSKSPFAAEKEKVKVVGNHLLIGFPSGELVHGIVPVDTSFDVSSTYELPQSIFKFKPWKFDIPVKEEVPVVEEKSAEPIKRKEAGDEDDEDEKEKEKKPAKKEVPPEEIDNSPEAVRKRQGLVITPDSKFAVAYFLPKGYFVASCTTSTQDIELRLCHILLPSFSRLLTIDTAPTVTVSESQSKKYLLLGSRDGCGSIMRFNLDDFLKGALVNEHETYSLYLERFQQRIEYFLSKNPNISIDLAKPLGPTDTYPVITGQIWAGHMHDILSGSIANVQTSFDDSFFVTAGADGGIFVLRNSSEKMMDNPILDGADVSNAIMQPEDITDPNAYSIQESKTKSEKDREIQKADERKQVIRNTIQELRNEFQILLAENEKLSPTIRLERSKICVDPYLEKDIQAEKQEKIATLKKELAWQSEKESIGPKKLQEKFLDPLEQEFIELDAFKSGKRVAAFRTLKLHPEVRKYLEPLLFKSRRMTADGTHSKENKTAASNTHGQLQKTGVTLADKAEHHGLSKLEARKQHRAARAALWKQLLESKPDDKYEDPKDVAAIRFAQTHMGDFKLKSADNYIVPENERIDADKKKRQIMLLHESVNSLFQNYNAQILKIRSKKKTLVEKFAEHAIAIERINRELAALGDAVTAYDWIPKMELAAFPETRYVVTDADVLQMQRVDAELRLKQTGDELGFGLGTTQNEQNMKLETQNEKKELAAPVAEPVSPVSPSVVDQTEVNNRKTILQYEKSKLISTIENESREFDETLNALRNERTLLEGDLKAVDLKLLLLYEEWGLLKEFEKFDRSLSEKLETKKSEASDIETKIVECREKLESKKLEVEGVLQVEKEIQQEFLRSLGENNKNEEYITKVFKRKIKRSKKLRENGGDQDEDEESDESDDYDFDDDEDMEEEEEEFEEKCPAECDSITWNRILELREKRLDQEEVVNEIQKAVDALKKENDSLLKKEKVISATLKATEVEIQEFHTQKQKKLNELHALVPLRFNQIQYLEQDCIPKELGATLVFLNTGFGQLRTRIKELQQEKADISKQHKELRKHHVTFHKSKKEKLAKLEELEERAKDVQMLKFGRIVDLEKLERLGVNKAADDLRDKLAKEDAKRLAQVMQFEKISRMQENLINLTRENTEQLEKVVQLRRHKTQIEDGLNQSQETVTAEYSGPQRKDVEERERIVALVQSQALQIQALKQEIEDLIRKPTAHVNAPEFPVEHGKPLETELVEPQQLEPAIPPTELASIQEA